MELIDTPNPNAKKIISDLSESTFSGDLNKIEGVSSVFFWSWFYNNNKNRECGVGINKSRHY